jgi:hypothetical protein
MVSSWPNRSRLNRDSSIRVLNRLPLALAIDSAGSRILDPIFLPKGKRRYTILEVDKTRSGQTTKIQYNDGTIAWMD